MGRAGGGGGGHSSGGGRSSGHVSGGSRMGSSSSRAGSGSFRSSSRPSGGGYHGGGGFGGPGMPPPIHRGPGMPPPIHRGPGMPPPPRRRRYIYGGTLMSPLISLFVWVVIILIIFGAMRASMWNRINSYTQGTTQSTIVRTKLETGNAYINNCVIDELGWFESTSKTATQLKSFWEATGVQPYIILKAYDASLTTDAQKEQWAEEYYDENFETQNIFLFVYFAEENADYDIGYRVYVNGYQTSSVMDSEAVEIFLNYIDRYWYTNLSTDDMFVNAFNDTASVIMHVSTTGKDIAKWVIILLVVIVAGVVIINVIKQKNRRAKEKAEEDARILNTPINDIASDNLEDKYLK